MPAQRKMRRASVTPRADEEFSEVVVWRECEGKARGNGAGNRNETENKTGAKRKLCPFHCENERARPAGCPKVTPFQCAGKQPEQCLRPTAATCFQSQIVKNRF